MGRTASSLPLGRQLRKGHINGLASQGLEQIVADPEGHYRRRCIRYDWLTRCGLGVGSRDRGDAAHGVGERPRLKRRCGAAWGSNGVPVDRPAESAGDDPANARAHSETYLGANREAISQTDPGAKPEANSQTDPGANPDLDLHLADVAGEPRRLCNGERKDESRRPLLD